MTRGGKVGEDVLATVGSAVGETVGTDVGADEGAAVGAAVGAEEGAAVGAIVGTDVGAAVALGHQFPPQPPLATVVWHVLESELHWEAVLVPLPVA